MFQFLTRIVEKQAKTKQTDEQRYRELIGKAAANSGELPVKDGDALEAVAQRLGIDPARIEADVAVMIEHAKLGAIAAGADAAGKTEKLAGEAMLAHQAESARILGERQKAELQLAAGLSEAQRQVNSIRKATDRQRELEKQHFALLGRLDPQIEARRRHLV